MSVVYSNNLARYFRWLFKLVKHNIELQNEVQSLKTQLQQQQRLNSENEILKDAIVRNVSHELKTPLLHLKSAIWMLAETVKDEKEAELARYAKQATSRLEVLVRNITLLSASSQTSPGLVIVRDAVDYAKRNLGRIWEYQKDIQRTIFLPEGEIPPVYVDKQGFATVLQLLIDNALKFSEKEVYIRAIALEKTVKITVEDCGIGISQDKLDLIFDTFYQVDSSSTRLYGGIGIGLSLVQLILDHHDVEIGVESEINKGTKFWFELPIAQIETEKKE